MTRKTKAKAKVVKFTARRRESMDLMKFINAHGGKLAPLRAYQVRPPSTSPAAPLQ